MALTDRWKLSRVRSSLTRTVAILFLLAAACFAAVYVFCFHHHVAIEQLSGDAIGGSLPRWLRGDSAWNLWHHNIAQAHVQTLLMLADVYVGPYPWWSRTFDVAAWIVFFLVLRSATPPPRGDVVAAIGALLWFCSVNHASLFTYSWVQVEVGCQLLALAGVLYAGRQWSSGPSGPTGMTLLLLGAWIFVFSHAHKGFYFPLAYGLVGTCLAKTRRQAICFAAFVACYLTYILWLDGFLPMFARQAQGGQLSSRDIVLGCALLGTGAIGSMLRELGVRIDLTSARIAIFIAGICMGLHATWRIARHRDARFVAAAAFIWPAVGMVVTTVLGRMSMLGISIEEGERYWYNSVFFLLGMVSYAAAWPGPWLFTALVALVGSAAVVLAANSFRPLPHYIRYHYTENAIQIGRAMHPEARWVHQGYRDHTLAGFHACRRLLERRRADVYSFWGFQAMESLRGPPGSVPACVGITVRRSREPFGEESADLLTAEFNGPLAADLAIVWEDGRPISMTYVLGLEGTSLTKNYAPTIAPHARLVFYRRTPGCGITAVCEAPVPSAHPVRP